MAEPVAPISPHLAAAAGPAPSVEGRILAAMTEVERWFRLKWRRHAPPFYGSVDLRNAGFKLTPVDTNLFPGGFNNLADDALPCAVQAAQVAVERISSDLRNLLLVPERHTRNPYYLSNVARLVDILRTAGLNVRVGSLAEDLAAPTRVELAGGESLLLEPVVRFGDRIGLAAAAGAASPFVPCVVLLNNDLSAGVPAVLRGLSPEQALRPPLHAGWAVRRKSTHFTAYDEVAAEFAALIGVDPWVLNAVHQRCTGLDFHARQGEEQLADAVADVLRQVAAKYREHQLADPPFAIVKADAGTYGMGVMTVRSPDDVRGLNRRQRNKMSVVKEGLEVSDVLVQEGVPTRETIDGAVAEPVVYMIDRLVAGGFYRVHRERGTDENLNAPGMHFVPVAFSGSCNVPEPDAGLDAPPNRFYTYGVVARLGLLAAAVELERTAGMLPPDPAAEAAGERALAG